MSPQSDQSGSVLLVYWGKRGPIAHFAAELAASALAIGERPVVSIAQESENAALFEQAAYPVLPVETFRSLPGCLAGAWRIPALRTRIASACRTHDVRAVVTLMAHVWSPAFASAWRANGIRHLSIVHDATPHPGDPTALLNRWLFRDAVMADEVIALSRHVAEQVRARLPGKPVRQLFLPDLHPGEPTEPRERLDGPVHVLFFGRILPYKGLDLFTQALELLHARSLPVRASVIGEGDMGPERSRLEALGATIVNHWIPEEAIDAAFRNVDVLVASHREASQSGVVALAHGKGIPVIVTPVGALPEQVLHGETGLVTADTSPVALADAMARVIEAPQALVAMAAAIVASRKSRSFPHFARLLFDEALRGEGSSR